MDKFNSHNQHHVYSFDDPTKLANWKKDRYGWTKDYKPVYAVRWAPGARATRDGAWMDQDEWGDLGYDRRDDDFGRPPNIPSTPATAATPSSAPDSKPKKLPATAATPSSAPDSKPKKLPAKFTKKALEEEVRYGPKGVQAIKYRPGYGYMTAKPYEPKRSAGTASDDDEYGYKKKNRKSSKKTPKKYRKLSRKIPMRKSIKRRSIKRRSIKRKSIKRRSIKRRSTKQR